MSEKVTTRAIILKRVPYGDADWIVAFFSREHGRLSGMAKSARKSVRRYGSGLEPGAVTSLTYAARAHSDLVNLEGSQVVFSTTGMMRSLARIEALSYALRLAISFLRDHQPAPEKFDLMEAYLAYLSRAEPAASSQLGFALKWLALSGYEPLLSCCVSCGGVPQGDAAFSADQGGVVCPVCAGGMRPSFMLSSRMRDAMMTVLVEPIGVDVDVADARPIAALVDRYVEHVLGKPLATG